MKKILLVFLLGFAALGLFACDGGSDKTELSFLERSITLEVGESISVEFTAPKALVEKLEVTSSKPNVATVKLESDKVTLTAKEAGTTVITLSAKDSDLSARLNVTVKQSESGAHFKNLDRVFFVDLEGDLEVSIRDAIRNVEAYDDDGSKIDGQIEIEGIEFVEVSQGAGATFELRLSIMKKDGEYLSVTITIELIGEVLEDQIVIFGPEKLTYYIGSQGFDLAKEFTAINIGSLEKENVEVVIDFSLPEEITLSTPGDHPITVRAEIGDLVATKRVVLKVHNQVNIPSEIDKGTAASPIKIRFAHGNGQDIEALFNKYARQFEQNMLADGYHVQVEIDKVGANYDEVRESITLLMQTGAELPNIVQNYPDHLVEYNTHGKIISLAPYAFHPVWGFGEDDSWYDIVQSYRDEQRAASATGDMLSMPFNKSTEVAIYNKSMFDAVLKGKKMPETWEDLIALAPQLREQVDANIARIAAAYNRAGNPTYESEMQTAKDQFIPFSYDSSGNAFITLTKAWAGQYTTQAKGKADKLAFYNHPQTVQMLTYFGENRDNFTSPKIWNNANYATDLFLKGYSAFSISSSAGADKNTPMVSSSLLFDIGLMPMPYSKLYPENRNVIQQGTNFSITTEGTATQKVISWLFLKHLNSVDISLDYAFEKGYFPTRYSVLETPKYQAFLALADLPLVENMDSGEANLIMRAKAAQVYFLQKDYMVFDLPFVGSSAVRAKVGVAIEDVLLALPADNLQEKITNALFTAYSESLKIVEGDD